MSQPIAPSNSSWQVGEPWQPILSSMREVETLFSADGFPAASSVRFGTRKSERPRVPAGAPGSLARTQCTMLRVRSWSPHEMKIFVPEIRYEPSACGSARVVTYEEMNQ
eukprot:6211349-Pleurochrysis_carterae.AAC.2